MNKWESGIIYGVPLQSQRKLFQRLVQTVLGKIDPGTVPASLDLCPGLEEGEDSGLRKSPSSPSPMAFQA